jgi:hypothetical protein
MYTNEEINDVLQMTNRLLHVPPKAEMDGTGWSKSHKIMDLLILYEDDFIAKCNHDVIFL